MPMLKITARALLACAASLLLLALAGCGDTATATTAPAPTATTGGAASSGDSGGAVAVSLFEWGIEPKSIEASAGAQTFNVVNKGKFPHNFTIVVEGGDKKTQNLP